MIRAVRLVIAFCVLIAGCSSGDAPEHAAVPSPSHTSTPATSSPASPPASAAPSDPCNLLSEPELKQLAGSAVSPARPGPTRGMANCQWTAAGGRFVQAIGTPSPYWAQSLPEALRAVEASGMFTEVKDLKKLRAGAELIKAGRDLNPGRGLFPFFEDARVAGSAQGASWTVLVAPSQAAPQSVTGQMCSGGRFTSVMVADPKGLKLPLPADQVAHALKSAHRKNLG